MYLKMNQLLTPFRKGYFNNFLNSTRSLSFIKDPANSRGDLQPSEQDTRPDLPPRNIENPYQRESKKCVLCRFGLELNYKNTRLLSQFVSPYTGRLYDKHITGLCDKQQKLLKQEIWKAYAAGFLSAHYKSPQYLADPRLFDPARPSRPNPH